MIKISAETSDELIKAGEAHIRQMTDVAHLNAVQMMQEARLDKAAADKWYADFITTFNNLPED